MDTALPLQPAAGTEKLPRPSFVDRIMDWIARLPIPYGLTYLLLFLLQSALSLVIAWIDGWLPAFTFEPLVLLFPFWLWGPLAMMTYLDRIAIQALNTVRPLLEISDAELEHLKREYAHMPGRGVLLSAAFWAVVYFILVFLARESFFIQYHLSALFSIYIILTGLLAYVTGSAIYYHSLRQLRLVNRTVRLIGQVNLFKLDPYYTFSKVTAQTGIAWVILLSMTLLTFPLQIAVVPALALLSLQVVLSLAAFILPLWVIHQRLVAEKRRLLAELNQRVEKLQVKLKDYLDQDDLDGIAPVNTAMSALQTQLDFTHKIPTWPWRAGLLTGFLSALVLPIVLFLLQLVLSRLLGD